MLYSIIPPVVVVLSLIAIIVFLMKRAARVANIDTGYIQEEERKNSALPAVAEKKFLVWFRNISANGKNFFARWKKNREEKRKKKLEKNHYILENKEEDSNLEQAEVVENIDEQEIFQRKSLREEKIAPKLPMENEKMNDSLTKVEKPRERKIATEKKDLFEKILVERIAANPKDIEAYERLGEYYLEIENWNYAKECFKQIIKLNPGSINAKRRMRKLERVLGG
jgi:tetratricopeptide (TPR) repeat protein